MKVCSLALSLAAWVPLVHAEEPLRVMLPIRYEDSASVRQAIKDQCTLEADLQATLEAQLQKTGFTPVNDVSQGRVLKVTILAADGYGGGAFSGPKSMLIRAEVFEGGVSQRKTTLSRQARAGSFAGTCGMLSRCAESLGKDVAKWLRNPRYAPPDESAALAAPVAASAVVQSEK